jgi:hypothetical protein
MPEPSPTSSSPDRSYSVSAGSVYAQEAHLVELFETGEHSTAEFADLFGVGRSTVYRALEHNRSATT